VEPEDILLITFTNNAAGEMKERVVANCDYSMSALRDAPINTFHGYCHDLLIRHGFDAPTRLGIDDRITSSTQLLENEVIEEDRFREFLDQFIEAHPEYHDYFRTLNDATSLLDLIKELAAKGVFPTDEGWFRDGESVLDGDYEAFETLFDEANEAERGRKRRDSVGLARRPERGSSAIAATSPTRQVRANSGTAIHKSTTRGPAKRSTKTVTT